MKHTEKYNILYDLQHGFRSQRSCETQLLGFIDDITKNLLGKKQTDTLIMDFSKAFDKVSHNRLIYKLDRYGIRGNTQNWIKSFLQDRTQSVVVNGTRSEEVAVTSGVPQGSVLGPCLFLLYINDIADNINSDIRLFADDTMIMYLAVTNNSDCQKLQADLDSLSEWEKTWKMEFHPEKCEVLSFSRSREHIKYDYTLNGHILKHVTKAKYLGVNLSSDLNRLDRFPEIQVARGVFR